MCIRDSFYGIMTLAIYSKKGGIDEKELRRDAFSLLKPYDDMSVEDINRFTTVSYTHLDVYKRQALRRMMWCVPWRCSTRTM